MTITILTGLFATAGSTAHAGYETAPYQVVRSDGKFELRNYPVLVWAETSRSGANGSFMRLFHFIGGNNAAKQKIPMTTPVFMAGEGTNATMAFVLPKNLSTNAVPKPDDPAVTIKEIRGGQFAVLRFSGGRNAQKETAALASLNVWVAQQKLKTVDGPIYGYFDPPWTLWFLRHNEVMLRVITP